MLSFITYLLDAGIQNGHALYVTFLLRKDGGWISFQDFKQKIGEALVSPQLFVGSERIKDGDDGHVVQKAD